MESSLSNSQAFPRRRFWSRSILVNLAAFYIALALLCELVVLPVWWAMRTETVSVRLRAASEATFGGAPRALPELRADLEESARLLAENGYSPRLLIEHYSDASVADLTELEAIGRAAGFEVVDAQPLAYPTPEDRD